MCHAVLLSTPRRRRSAEDHPLSVPQPPLLLHHSCRVVIVVVVRVAVGFMHKSTVSSNAVACSTQELCGYRRRCHSDRCTFYACRCTFFFGRRMARPRSTLAVLFWWSVVVLHRWPRNVNRLGWVTFTHRRRAAWKLSIALFVLAHRQPSRTDGSFLEPLLLDVAKQLLQLLERGRACTDSGINLCFNSVQVHSLT